MLIKLVGLSGAIDSVFPVTSATTGSIFGKHGDFFREEINLKVCTPFVEWKLKSTSCEITMLFALKISPLYTSKNVDWQNSWKSSPLQYTGAKYPNLLLCIVGYMWSGHPEECLRPGWWWPSVLSYPTKKGWGREALFTLLQYFLLVSVHPNDVDEADPHFKFLKLPKTNFIWEINKSFTIERYYSLVSYDVQGINCT